MQTVLCDLSFAFPKKYCMAGWIGLASSIFWTSSYKYPKPWPTTPDPRLPAITLSSMGLARPLLQRLKKSTISIRYHISYWTLLQTRPEVFFVCYNNHRHIETHCCAGFVRVLVTWLKWFLTYIWQPWFCTTFCKASATIGTHLWMKAKWVWSKRQVMV